MKMDIYSIGDEVRFRTSPVIINGDPQTSGQNLGGKAGSSKMKLLKSSAPESEPRRVKLQPMVNADGLLELSLANRGLREIPEPVLTLMRLEVLKVNNNQLHALPNDISRLHKLRKLDLSHNFLIALPETIPNLIHLVELDVSYNELNSLPQPLSKLSHLQVLTLAQNNFDNLPNEFGELTALKKLDLSYNRLWHLPSSVQHLHSLLHLDLSGNLFDQLPISVCSLKHLEALNLQDNKLLNLPAQSERLQHLKELNLAGNCMEMVPVVVSQIKSLQVLDLSRNKLKSIPARLSRLPKLRSLTARHNAISALPNNLANLEHLDVSYNQLHNFSLAHTKKLRHLDASHNVLENLPLGVYVLPQLETLLLNTNYISYVSQDIVLLRNLRVLDLGNNRLTNLPQVVDELSNLEAFNIKGNPFESRPLHQGLSHHNGGLKGGNPDYLTEDDDLDNNLHTKSYPLFKKKGGGRSKDKNKWRQKHSLVPHSRNAGTQYTPKSSVRARERPPLDYVPRSGSLSTVFATPKSRGSLPSRYSYGNNTMTRSLAPTHASEHTNAAYSGSHHKPVQEIDYPLANTNDTKTETPQNSRRDPSLTSVKQLASVQSTNKADTRPKHGSIRSDTVTVNETIGDGLSLGDEDFEFQPITVKDTRLMGVCSEVETMLNKQLLQPIMPNRGIFRKTVNEGGTMRMLRGLDIGHISDTDLSTQPLSPHVTHRDKDIIMKRPPGKAWEGTELPLTTTIDDNSVMRSRMDSFLVTPSGGMFRSSMDSNVGIYFPVNAVETPITITMQLEKISQEALMAAKNENPLVNNLLAIGPIIHIRQDRVVELHNQVALTIPAPQSSHNGSLHIMTFRDNNTCTPCSAHYKLHRGYITIQTWNFSGKGAVLSKSRNKYKACKATEQLLRELYV